MPKSQKGGALQEFLRFVETVIGSPPQMVDLGSAAGPIQVAKCAQYPAAGLTTFVTLGASEQRFSIFRGRDVGFELTLALSKEDPALVAFLVAAVLENLRLGRTRERRPFILYNCVYAPGYPPHLLFTDEATCTPEFNGRKRIGDKYIYFLAAIPLDDAELREYDRSVPGLLQQLRSGGRVADYPRRG